MWWIVEIADESDGFEMIQAESEDEAWKIATDAGLEVLWIHPEDE